MKHEPQTRHTHTNTHKTAFSVIFMEMRQANNIMDGEIIDFIPEQ